MWGGISNVVAGQFRNMGLDDPKSGSALKYRIHWHAQGQDFAPIDFESGNPADSKTIFPVNAIR
jgi:hypothetical protein